VRDVERFSRRVRHVGARATAWARAGVCGGSLALVFAICADGVGATMLCPVPRAVNAARGSRRCGV